MDRQTLQLALMSRGIRIADDDPLFVVMEANELHFEELVERHFRVLDQYVTARMVELAVAKYSETQENQRHNAALNCVLTPGIETSVARLESATKMLSQFEGRMTDAARMVAGRTSREVAGHMLSKLVRDIGIGLSQLLALQPDSAAKSMEESAKTAMQASIQIRAAVERAEARCDRFAWLFSGLLIVALCLGVFVGHQTTTGAFERVQAACTAEKTTR